MLHSQLQNYTFSTALSVPFAQLIPTDDTFSSSKTGQKSVIPSSRPKNTYYINNLYDYAWVLKTSLMTLENVISRLSVLFTTNVHFGGEWS